MKLKSLSYCALLSKFCKALVFLFYCKLKKLVFPFFLLGFVRSIQHEYKSMVRKVCVFHYLEINYWPWEINCYRRDNVSPYITLSYFPAFVICHECIVFEFPLINHEAVWHTDPITSSSLIVTLIHGLVFWKNYSALSKGLFELWNWVFVSLKILCVKMKLW